MRAPRHGGGVDAVECEEGEDGAFAEGELCAEGGAEGDGGGFEGRVGVLPGGERVDVEDWMGASGCFGWFASEVRKRLTGNWDRARRKSGRWW